MIVRDGSSTDRIAAAASLSNDKAVELFTASGFDLNALRDVSVSRDFRPVTLKVSLSGTVHNQVREIETNNVVAKIEGSDAALRNEYVIYSGHWDHMGRQGDNIFHGASDIASGTAGILELAHGFSELPKAPKRTVCLIPYRAQPRQPDRLLHLL